MASTACRVAGGSRVQPHPPHLSRRGRNRHLATDQPEHPRVGFQAGDIGFDLQRNRAHRQHPAFDTEYASKLVEGGNRISQHLVEAGEYQVTDRMPGQSAVAAESVLQDGRPQLPVGAVRC